MSSAVAREHGGNPSSSAIMADDETGIRGICTNFLKFVAWWDGPALIVFRLRNEPIVNFVHMF